MYLWGPPSVKLATRTGQRLNVQGTVDAVAPVKESRDRIPSPIEYFNLFFLTPLIHWIRPTHIEGYLFYSKSTYLSVTISKKVNDL